MQKPDTEQVQFINSLIADPSRKTETAYVTTQAAIDVILANPPSEI